MYKKSKPRRGFTMVETLFGVSIFVIIVGLLTLFSRNIWVYNDFITSGLSLTTASREVLKTFTSEIRTASTADTGAYTISAVETSSFTFYSDIDGDGLREKVRYFLSGTSFRKGVVKPTGSPLAYNPANEVISTLIDGIVTSILFEYYDSSYDGTTPALSYPISIPSVRLIKITIVLDKDPNRPPLPRTFSTQVTMRNLKDNL